MPNQDMIINFHLCPVLTFVRAESLTAVTESEWRRFSSRLLRSILLLTRPGETQHGGTKLLDNSMLPPLRMLKPVGLKRS